MSGFTKRSDRGNWSNLKWHREMESYYGYDFANFGDEIDIPDIPDDLTED